MADLSFLSPKLQQSAIQGGIEIPEELPELDMTEPSAPSMNPLDLVSKGVGQVANMITPQDEVNEKFMSRNKNIAQQLKRESGLSSTLSNAAMKSGNPIAMGIGASLLAGDKLVEGATDEFGVVQDSLKGIIGGVLNPIKGVSTLMNQKGRREQRDKFVNTEMASKRAETQVAGNKITNSIAKYTPPSYGRFGRKLTKFTR